jgi:hypothetical protein
MLQPRKIQALPACLKQDRTFDRTAQTVCLSVLKRFSSLILALVIGSSVLAGTVRPSTAHVCNMPSMEIMPSTEMMPGMHMDQGMDEMPGMEMMPGMHMDQGMDAMPGVEMTPGMHMDHVIEAMPGAEPMPCCKKHMAQLAVSEPGSGEQCCVNIPQELGTSGTAFNLLPPSFSVAIVHPAVVQPPLAVPKQYEHSYSTEVFLPNLQATYIRNLAFLI